MRDICGYTCCPNLCVKKFQIHQLSSNEWCVEAWPEAVESVPQRHSTSRQVTSGQLLIHAGVWGCPCSQCGSRALVTRLATAGHSGLSPGSRMGTKRARRLRPQPARHGANQPVNSSTGLFNLNTSHILILTGKNSSPRRWLVAQSRREP